jgi:hypothetical protein
MAEDAEKIDSLTIGFACKVCRIVGRLMGTAVDVKSVKRRLGGRYRRINGQFSGL